MFTEKELKAERDLNRALTTEVLRIERDTNKNLTGTTHTRSMLSSVCTCTIPYHTLSHPTLSHPITPYPITPYHTLPYHTLSHQIPIPYSLTPYIHSHTHQPHHNHLSNTHQPHPLSAH